MEAEDNFTIVTGMPDVQSHPPAEPGVMYRVCNLGFTHKLEFKKRIQTHNGERSSPRNFYSSPVNHKSRLKSHIPVQMGKKFHRCSFCGASFGDRSALNKHAAIHTLEKRFVCDTCGAAFSQKAHLQTKCVYIRERNRTFVRSVASVLVINQL